MSHIHAQTGIGWKDQKLNACLQQSGIQYDPQGPDGSFIRKFFAKLFEISPQQFNWTQFFETLERKREDCFKVSCSKGPVFPEIKFAICELESFYQTSIGVLFAKLFNLTTVSDPSCIMLRTDLCSCQPDKNTEICLNPFHYDTVPQAPMIPPAIHDYQTDLPIPPSSWPSPDTNWPSPNPDQINQGMVATYNGQEMNPAEDVQRREITRREQNTEEKTHSAKITARDNKKQLAVLKEKATEQKFWCSISYYEFNERVGEVWEAPKSIKAIVIDGYTNPNDGAGAPNRFSLGLLTNINRTTTCDESRRYIGKGCSLIADDGDVWILNQSESSIFVQSPICNLFRHWHPATVVKIPKDCSIKIFDNNKFEEFLCSKIRCGYEETFNIVYYCKLKISFVKGWGALYTRQTVTACPCWVEFRLNEPLGLLDAALQELKPVDKMSSNDS